MILEKIVRNCFATQRALRAYFEFVFSNSKYDVNHVLNALVNLCLVKNASEPLKNDYNGK